MSGVRDGKRQWNDRAAGALDGDPGEEWRDRAVFADFARFAESSGQVRATVACAWLMIRPEPTVVIVCKVREAFAILPA